MSETTHASPAPRRSTAARVASATVGAIVGLVAFGLLAAGGALLWGSGHEDRAGYLATGSDPFVTSTRALATQSLDVNTDGPDWLVEPDRYGKVRLKVKSHTDKPVFVGIARTSDVTGYLSGAAHATVTDVNYSPFRASYRTHSGDRRPARPADQRFWVASAHGAGTQTVTWDIRRGSWSIVVMNADASAGVDAGVSAGAHLPWLSAAGWGAIGGGLILLTLAGGIVYLGNRAPRIRRSDRDAVDPSPAPAA